MRCTISLALGLDLWYRRGDAFWRVQLGTHVGWLPVPVTAAVAGQHLLGVIERFFPAVGQHRGPQGQQALGVLDLPEQAAAFQAQVDDAANGALDGTAAQGNPAAATHGVVHGSGLGMVLQVDQFAAYLRVVVLVQVSGQDCPLGHQWAAAAGPQGAALLA